MNSRFQKSELPNSEAVLALRQPIIKRALIIQGGFPPHKPKEVADILAGLLKQENYEVEIADTLDVLLDNKKMQAADLIVMNWTNGIITKEQLRNLLYAVYYNGTGLAGMHGGMGDTFRCEIDYQLMAGGHYVAHPGGKRLTYSVQNTQPAHPIMQGISDFTVTTELYYMMVDPAIQVLAASHYCGVPVPVVWTKGYGQATVFYCSLGHSLDIVTLPQVMAIMRRGMLWASRRIES